VSWIESHQELARHPKTKRLARVLQEPEVAVIGRLHCLWWWALDYADDGDLSGMEPSDIADACQWEGDAEAFIAAMVQVHFLDQDSDGLRIHDWADYAGRLVEKRRQNIERVKRWRADNGNRTNGTDTHTERAYVTHNESIAPQSPLITNHEAHAPPHGTPKNGAIAGPMGVTHNESVRYTATVPYRTLPDSTLPDPTGPEDPGACAPDGAVSVSWVWDYYRDEIQPDARVCPREKIRARLKRFEVDELTQGIENFAADAWWMAHNGTRGGAWFFHSDARSEQFLTMEPRAALDAQAPRRLHG
jgi:hypothetical protein